MHSNRKAKYYIDSESNTKFHELTTISSMTNRSTHFLKYVARAQTKCIYRKIGTFKRLNGFCKPVCFQSYGTDSCGPPAAASRSLPPSRALPLSVTPG